MMQVIYAGNLCKVYEGLDLSYQDHARSLAWDMKLLAVYVRGITIYIYVYIQQKLCYVFDLTL